MKAKHLLILMGALGIILSILTAIFIIPVLSPQTCRTIVVVFMIIFGLVVVCGKPSRFSIFR